MVARFLNEQDRVKAVERVQENKTGIKNNVWKLPQAVEATLDIKIWLLVLIQLSQNVANGGVQSVSLTTCDFISPRVSLISPTQFSSIVIKGFGFSTLTTLLVQMISTAFQLVFVLLASAGSTYFTNSRTYFLAANLSISIAGSAMIRQIDMEQTWTRFFGYCLNMAFTANFPIILSMSSANVAGFTKKSTSNSMVRPRPKRWNDPCDTGEGSY